MQEIREGFDNYYGNEMTDQEISDLFTHLDVGGNGYVEYTEFVAAALHKEELLSIDNVRAAFKHFDASGTNAISKDDLEDVLAMKRTSSNKLTPSEASELDRLIGSADKQGDGLVDFAEFDALLKRETNKR